MHTNSIIQNLIEDSQNLIRHFKCGYQNLIRAVTSGRTEALVGVLPAALRSSRGLQPVDVVVDPRGSRRHNACPISQRLMQRIYENIVKLENAARAE